MPCIIDQLYPETGRNMCHLFKRLGLRVDFPLDSTCCGQLLFKSGYWSKARSVAKKILLSFRNAHFVVSPSSSCVNMIRNHYRELFRGDKRWSSFVQDLSSKTYEFCEFLVNVLDIHELGVSMNAKVVYHESCQLKRTSNEISEGRVLLKSIRGIEIMEIPESDKCCGFGGIFSFMFPDISHGMVKEKSERIISSGAQMVVGAEMSCLSNIGGYMRHVGAPVKAIHIVDLLAKGL